MFTNLQKEDIDEADVTEVAREFIRANKKRGHFFGTFQMLFSAYIVEVVGFAATYDVTLLKAFHSTFHAVRWGVKTNRFLSTIHYYRLHSPTPVLMRWHKPVQQFA